MDKFNFCGKIALGRESDKFHPVDRREFQSGWMNTTVKFNCISGMNRILCMAQGGKWKVDNKNIIKTYSKSTTDENGKTIKGEVIDIPWSKRFDPDEISKVAGFRKFTCDTGDTKMRYKFQDLVDAFENGNVTDEMMEQVGIDNEADAKAALEKSQAKKRVFLSEYDFVEHLVKVLQSGKYKDRLFYISGNYDVQYNPDKQQFYTNYHVNRVVLAPDDAEPNTELKIDYFFGEDAWDDSQRDENGKCYVNGWVSYYDNNLKCNGFKPTVIAIKEANEKALNRLKTKFNIDDGIKQIGLTLMVIEGAERVEITLDMLSEEEREDIECGLLDFEEVKRSMNNSVVGDRVSELRFIELTPKKNVVQDTIYTVEDMHPAMAKQEDEVMDIFSDDDDDL